MDRILAPALLGSGLVFTSLVTLGACSSTSTLYVEAGPTQGSYTIQFPSTAAAVATETVEVLVFDASVGGGGGQCFSLVQKRQSHQQLPATIVASAPVSPCDVQSTGAGAVTVPFGKVAILAVGTRKSADFLIGCTEGTVTPDNTNVVVQLSLAGTGVSVPTTTCTDLKPYCSGSCK